MKEAVLSVKDGDGIAARKVKVTLTKDNLILQEVSSKSSPISSTAIDSPVSSNSGAIYSRQTTSSLSSTESSSRGGRSANKHPTVEVDTAIHIEEQNTIMPTDNNHTKDRVVTIKRQPGGGLGISVKGGAEHGIPVLISRVFPGQAADQTDLLHPGDAIIAVNDKHVEHMMHDSVVAELRSCGPEVALTVRAFDGANSVLRPPGSSTTTPTKTSTSIDQPHSPTEKNNKFNKDSNSFKQLNAVTSEATTNGAAQASNSRGNNAKVISDSNASTKRSLNGSLLKNEKVIPLPFARLERYIKGTDTLREGGFEVISKDNVSSGYITCSSEEELDEWLSSVSEAINNSTMLNAASLIKDTSNDVIAHMGWAEELSQASLKWSPCFLVITKGKLNIYSSPPENSEDFQHPRRVLNLYESLLRVHHPPRQLLDERQHCFSIQNNSKPPMYCSVQTKDDLSRWQAFIQNATNTAVYAIQSRSYACSVKGKPCTFVIHFNDGFKLLKSPSQEVLWQYNFSQLRGSSDDGSSMICFMFHDRVNDQIEERTLKCGAAFSLLFCVHAFLAAKLSLVDPTFLEKVNAQTNPLHDVTSGVINGNKSSSDENADT